jgi:hypothetical protein
MGDDTIETIQTFRSLTVCEIFVELAWPPRRQRVHGPARILTTPHQSTHGLANSSGCLLNDRERYARVARTISGRCQREAMVPRSADGLTICRRTPCEISRLRQPPW